MFDVVVNEIFQEEVLADILGPDGEGGVEDPAYSIQVRTFNLRDSKAMRDLNPSDIDQMICVRGMITRATAIIPELAQARSFGTLSVLASPSPAAAASAPPVPQRPRCSGTACAQRRDGTMGLTAPLACPALSPARRPASSARRARRSWSCSTSTTAASRSRLTAPTAAARAR